MHADVTIIGAGLAGLCCASALIAGGARVQVLEASDGVGGRVRTDVVEGFRLDRGFQVYLTAYPEASRVLDHRALDLRSFEPGAVVMHAGKRHILMDPWRRPGSLLDGAMSSIGTLADKLKVGLMRSELQKLGPEAIYDAPEQTTLAELESRGFSKGFIDRFFRPFFGGIMLDDSLAGSSRMMRFVFRNFSLGDGAVPALGMGEIPAQLAAGLPAGTVHLNTPALKLDGTTAHTPSGRGTADRVVLACAAHAEAELLGKPAAKIRAWRGVTNVYFAIPGPPPTPATGPGSGGVLILDGDRSGLVLNLAFMSSVSDAYAPPGMSLASCSLLGVRSESDDELNTRVLGQMRGWFGEGAVQGWRHLRTYRIARALPDQSPPWLTRPVWAHKVSETVYRCGDHTETASIDGAMLSGRLCAQGVLGVA